jgi:hypothetical protein
MDTSGLPPGLDYDALVDAVQAHGVLGSGSNGCVLDVTLPDAWAHSGLPVGVPLALKVVSHFWDDGAQACASRRRGRGRVCVQRSLLR